MCGFVGFTNKINDASIVLGKMMDRIKHRGPDSDGKYVDEQIAMGFRRLSIIDLSDQGSQPIFNEDKSLVLTFNGEIYNYKDLREELIAAGHKFYTQTDSEVLIHGYEQWGEDMLDKLRGMFAFVIFNKNTNEVFGARDFFGIKPLYYAKMGETLMWGSEIKSFLDHPHFKKELNTDVLETYLNNFGQKIAFEMPSDKYIEIFNSKVSEIGAIPGRGFANVTIKPDNIEGTFRMNAPYEVQCYISDQMEPDSSFLFCLKSKYHYNEESGREENGKFDRCVKKHLTFNGDLTRDEYQRLKQEPITTKKNIPWIPCPVSVGLDYIDFCPVTIDFSESRVLGIYGKKGYGKTNLLRVILEDLFKKKSSSRFVFFDDGRKQLEEFYNRCESLGLDCIKFYETKRNSPLPPNNDSGMNQKTPTDFMDIIDKPTTASGFKKTLSPFQQFYHFINDYYMDLTWNGISNNQLKSPVATYIYGEEMAGLMPSYNEELNPIKPTVFILQSKMLYLSANGEKQFINNILPKLAAIAEEKDLIFIFTDVQKITDQESNNFFNNSLNAIFLLDSIAEFAAERGQKTVFGSMDVKGLREEYARCETGDGYFYDIEADKLMKMKFIRQDKWR